MPKVSNYTRERIESLYMQDLHPAEIFNQVKKENSPVSFASITRIIKKLQLTGSVKNLKRSGRPTKLTAEAKAVIETMMRRNDEATRIAIQKNLAKQGVAVHASTVRRSRKQQGWTLQTTRYCQLIKQKNKDKRLEFARQVLDSEDTFDVVIFSNECSVSLQQYRRMCYRKVGELTKRKPKPKHALKVHVWAGISRHGASKICIFDGIMNAILYCNILQSTLIPFLMETLPEHRFMQDNDPKRLVVAFVVILSLMSHFSFHSSHEISLDRIYATRICIFVSLNNRTPEFSLPLTKIRFVLPKNTLHFRSEMFTNFPENSQ